MRLVPFWKTPFFNEQCRIELQSSMAIEQMSPFGHHCRCHSSLLRCSHSAHQRTFVCCSLILPPSPLMCLYLQQHTSDDLFHFVHLLKWSTYLFRHKWLYLQLTDSLTHHNYATAPSQLMLTRKWTISISIYEFSVVRETLITSRWPFGSPATYTDDHSWSFVRPHLASTKLQISSN